MIPARAAVGPAEPAVVRLDQLRVGDLLAEGGEGRVYQLPRQPHLVYKAYRQAVPAEHLARLVAWPAGLGAGPLTTVRAAAAWPTSVVEDRAGTAVGLLLPRAPRRFAVRHRDGQSRLASLSYLTADPGHRAAAYGLALPEPVTAARIGIVYALARLLAAFESTGPAIGHGDLSTKNVLWSLARGPEVYVLDCDSAALFSGSEELYGGRRRAMTPNWNDPAVPRGANPSAASDRYSLALIFVRVVGAANFPVQSRQREGGPVDVEVPIPARTPGAALLGDGGARVWELCSRGLGIADPGGRAAPQEWVEALGGLLRAIGGAEVERQVVAQQGGWRPPPSPAAGAPAAGAPAAGAPAAGARVAAAPVAGDVAVVPVMSAARAKPVWSKVTPLSRYGATAQSMPLAQPASPTGPAGSGRLVWVPLPTPSPPAAGLGAGAAPGGGAGQGAGATTVPGPPPAPLWPQVKAQARAAVRSWVRTHARAFRLLWRAGHPARGLVLLAGCALVDLLAVLLVGAVVAIVAAPLLGL